MIKRMKNIIKNHKVIVWNIMSLWGLQAWGYLMPIIALPYILRVLGPERYWLIMFSLWFVAYFSIIISYSFYLTATKDIANHKNDNEKVSEIFSNVIFTKLLLFVFSAIIFLVLIFSFDIFRVEHMVFIYTFIGLFGDVLFPTYVFQWMEKMKYMTIVGIVIWILVLLSIFVFIRTIDDYYILPLIYSISSIVAWIVSIILALKKFKIKFVRPKLSIVKYNLVEWWHVFISWLFISLYTTSTNFIVWLITNNTIVWYYAAANKVIRAIKEFLRHIIQSIYPSIPSKLKISKEYTISFLKRINLFVVFVVFVGSIILFLGADVIIKFVFGSEFFPSVIIFRILSLTPLIVWLNMVFGHLIMLNFWYKKYYSYIITSVSLISLVMSIIFTTKWSGVWMAISVLFTEIIILLSMYVFLKKKWIKLI